MTDAFPKPRPRFLQFSLRALLVALTLLAVWCGYYVHWIAERWEAKRWIEAHPVQSFDAVHPGVVREFPWQLTLFGESEQSLIVTQVRDETAEEYQRQIERLRRLFPEADIYDGATWYEATQPSVSRQR